MEDEEAQGARSKEEGEGGGRRRRRKGGGLVHTPVPA